MYFPTGVTTERGRGRGVFGGGNPGTAEGTMQYVEIQSQGNAIDFGDLTVADRFVVLLVKFVVFLEEMLIQLVIR